MTNWTIHRERRKGGRVLIVDPDEMRTVASILKGGATDEEQMADANLFRAAPDLYESLKAIVEKYGHTSDTDEWKAACATLKSAEGGDE